MYHLPSNKPNQKCLKQHRLPTNNQYIMFQSLTLFLYKQNKSRRTKQWKTTVQRPLRIIFLVQWTLKINTVYCKKADLLTDNQKHARVMFRVHCTSVGHKCPIHQFWKCYIKTSLRQWPKTKYEKSNLYL